MDNFLKSFRLGTVQLFGIILPGLLMVTLLIVGFGLPLLSLSYHFHGNFKPESLTDNLTFLRKVSEVFSDNIMLWLIILIVFSYVVGYAIRLSSPDELDRISGRKVLKTMLTEAKKIIEKSEKEKKKEILKNIKTIIRENDFSKNKIQDLKNKIENSDLEKEMIAGAIEALEEIKIWPFTGKESDKFPYFHYKDYIEAREVADEVSDSVTWGLEKEKKRSKTHVNWMKLKIRSEKQPELEGIIDSNEAHIRLMFGTWVATEIRWLIGLGILFSLIGILGMQRQPYTLYPPYGIFLIINIIFLIVLGWIRERIQKLFHYQRVRELTHVIMCYAIVKGKY